MAKCNEEVGKVEQLRNEKLFEVGNLLHESVPISNDEVCKFNYFQCLDIDLLWIFGAELETRVY